MRLLLFWVLCIPGAITGSGIAPTKMSLTGTPMDYANMGDSAHTSEERLSRRSCDTSLLISCSSTAPCADTNAECVTNWLGSSGCECTNSTCAVDASYFTPSGRCVDPFSPTAAPTLSPTLSPTSPPTPSPTDNVCRDLNVTYLNMTSWLWESQPWQSGPALGALEFHSNGVSCTHFAPSEMKEHTLEVLGDFAYKMISTRTKSLDQGGLGGDITFQAASLFGLLDAAGSLGDVLWNQWSNDCNNAGMNNWVQALSGFNYLTAADACCACGGGTTQWRTPSSGVTAALLDLYKSLNGEAWFYSTGWNASIDYCLWDFVRCDAQSQLFSLKLAFNNVTGTLPRSIGNLTTLQMLFIGPQPQPKDISLLFNGNPENETIPFISGTLPNELTNLTALNTLILAPLGGLSGTLPDVQFSGSNNDTEDTSMLAIAEAHISGTISSEWSFPGYFGHVMFPPNGQGYATVAELERVFANTISGVLPHSFGSSKSLRSLNLVRPPTLCTHSHSHSASHSAHTLICCVIHVMYRML